MLSFCCWHESPSSLLSCCFIDMCLCALPCCGSAPQSRVLCCLCPPISRHSFSQVFPWLNSTIKRPLAIFRLARLWFTCQWLHWWCLTMWHHCTDAPFSPVTSTPAKPYVRIYVSQRLHEKKTKKRTAPNQISCSLCEWDKVTSSIWEDFTPTLCFIFQWRQQLCSLGHQSALCGFSASLSSQSSTKLLSDPTWDVLPSTPSAFIQKCLKKKNQNKTLLSSVNLQHGEICQRFHVWCETRKWQQDAVVVKAKWMHISRPDSAAGASPWSYAPDNLMNVTIPQLFSLIFLLHQLVAKLVFLSSAAGQLASSDCSKRSIILLQNWLIGAEETLSHQGFAKWCLISSGKISTSNVCHWKSPFWRPLETKCKCKGRRNGICSKTPTLHRGRNFLSIPLQHGLIQLTLTLTILSRHSPVKPAELHRLQEAEIQPWARKAWTFSLLWPRCWRFAGWISQTESVTSSRSSGACSSSYFGHTFL